MSETSSSWINEVSQTGAQQETGLVSRLVIMSSIPAFCTDLWHQNLLKLQTNWKVLTDAGGTTSGIVFLPNDMYPPLFFFLIFSVIPTIFFLFFFTFYFTSWLNSFSTSCPTFYSDLRPTFFLLFFTSCLTSYY